jgi:RHS repeat-associated protein
MQRTAASAATESRPTRRAKIILTALLFALSLCRAARAQAPDGQSPARGFQPSGSYAISETESVSLTNGNMTYMIPLASLPPSRGGRLRPAVSLIYNSKLYDTNVRICNGCQFPYTENSLVPASGGGWRYGVRYALRNTNRSANYLGGAPPNEATYKFKTSVVFPDGSSHPINPLGHSPFQDYYNVYPGQLSTPMTYYSTDGTYFRVVVQPQQTAWTIYFGDGTTVQIDEQTGTQTTTDGNGNSYTVQDTALANGTPLTVITDQLGRKITIEKPDSAPHSVRVSGYGGTELVTTLNWGRTSARGKKYLGRVYQDEIEELKTLSVLHKVVNSITLPNGLSYQFAYNSDIFDPNNSTKSVGWGELSQVTLPTGAIVKYRYKLDNIHGDDDERVEAKDVLQNYPSSKRLTYIESFDGVNTERTDTWGYHVEYGQHEEVVSGSMAGPDGGLTTEYFFPSNGSNSFDKAGLSYKTKRPDGSLVERIWLENIPYASTGVTINPYVKTEFVSIVNAAGAPVWTAIKDYNYDKNGNVMDVAEYDWVPYGDVPRDAAGRPFGIPDTAQIRRVSVNTYYNPTPAATIDFGGSPNNYNQGTAPNLRQALKSSEMRSGFSETSVVARTELVYDDPFTKGNLTIQRSWDSTKNYLFPPDASGNRLNPGNSISFSHQYDAYGNRTLTTDARSYQTRFTYGEVNGFDDLYPTEVKSALGTSVEQVRTHEYDFNTGLVTRSVDTNGMAVVTEYDAFGRPTWVKRAVNTPAETHARMIYSDTERRVITRSNLDSLADARHVSIFHYDQLGRVRLSRRLENSQAQMADAPTAAETDESVGIKVQSRSLYNGQNSYQLVSNPYRAATSAAAASEATMGWARTKFDNAGRIVEAQTLRGSALPFPWNADPASTNALTTGIVSTFYDGEFMTIIDPEGKQRRSMTDALGRLVRVDEQTAAGLGLPASPHQPTCYTYDALSNLRFVRQGGRWQNGQCQSSPQPDRVFEYNSLSRVTSTTNPEGGVISYEYDENGNLKKKMDARLLPGSQVRVAIAYDYDALDRITTRTYNDGTPNVSYFYDSQALPANAPFFERGLSAGRLVAVTYGGGATGSYMGGYDSLGRVGRSLQVTDTGTVEGLKTYDMAYAYNLAGNLISETYPSGRVVKPEYDAAGRLSGVRNGASGSFYVGGARDDDANRIGYAAHGAASAIRLGNGRWEHRSFNARLQAVEIGLGETPTDSSLLKLEYAYGVIANNVIDPTRNNGNLRKQKMTAPGITLEQTYEYDEQNRLKWAREASNQIESWKQIYEYDAFGNRTFAAGTTMPALTVDAAGGLQPDPLNNPAISPETNQFRANQGYTFDPAGNLKTKPGYAYSYDAENRMISADDGQAGGLSAYSYDGEGKRVRKVTASGTTTTLFIYDAFGKIVAEYATQPSQQSGTKYLTADHLGSPRVVSDAAGNVQARHDYLPFGEEIGEGVGGRTALQGYVSDTVRQKFTGYERDAETGLDYAQARYYNAAHGRFTSPDPLLASARRASPKTWNRYAYALNNPLRFVDPDGLIAVAISLENLEGQEPQDGRQQQQQPVREEQTATQQCQPDSRTPTAKVTIITYKTVTTWRTAFLRGAITTQVPETQQVEDAQIPANDEVNARTAEYIQSTRDTYLEAQAVLNNPDGVSPISVSLPAGVSMSDPAASQKQAMAAGRAAMEANDTKFVGDLIEMKEAAPGVPMTKEIANGVMEAARERGLERARTALKARGMTERLLITPP